MTAHAKMGLLRRGGGRVFVRRGTAGSAHMVKGSKASAGALFIPAQAMDESLEDARLNAIADERANGPFVSVSLDEL